MFVAALLFLSASLLHSDSMLSVKPSPVFADVYIGTDGPYRFLVDTGAQTSLIDPKLAAKLRLRPEFRVELLTQQSSHFVSGAKLTNLKIGTRTLPETEILFHDVTQARQLDPSVNGVLGRNALSTFDFTLSPPTGRFEDTAERPAGEVVPYFEIEGRMAIKARMGDEILTLILDSGSNHMVLFRLPVAMEKVRPVTTTMTTIEGARSVVPTCWSAEIRLGDQLRIATLPAAIVQANGTEAEGLLPVSIFKKVHVDQARHELILVR
jgi:predicted aspartyl protease